VQLIQSPYMNFDLALREASLALAAAEFIPILIIHEYLGLWSHLPMHRANGLTD